MSFSKRLLPGSGTVAFREYQQIPFDAKDQSDVTLYSQISPSPRKSASICGGGGVEIAPSNHAKYGVRHSPEFRSYFNSVVYSG